MRIPIPPSPEALIAVATRLDVFWAAMQARGYRKPDLEEEMQLIAREYECG